MWHCKALGGTAFALHCHGNALMRPHENKTNTTNSTARQARMPGHAAVLYEAGAASGCHSGAANLIPVMREKKGEHAGHDTDRPPEWRKKLQPRERKAGRGWRRCSFCPALPRPALPGPAG